MITPTKAAPAVTDLDIVRSALTPDYDDVRELGRGGMAIVYRARERALDRDVAIKVLPFTMAFDQSTVERFLREARTAASLEHPHIIPIYRVGQSGQVTHFVMKLLRGQSLADRLLERGPLSPAETRRVLTETAGALGYAHQKSVVHRDIKPDNILLDEGGRCVVTDFGIARSGGQAKLTATGTSVGTPRYMSPEQARAKEVDGRSDIYSLGVVGYECLTGRPPFDGDDIMAVLMAHIGQPLPRPHLDSPEAAAVYAVIERMLAKSPDDRFGSAEEIVAALSAPMDSTVRLSGVAPHPAAKPVGAAVGAAGRVIAGQVPRVRALAGALGTRLADVRSAVAARPRRHAALFAGAAVLAIGVPTTSHFALHHRSRCPVAPPASASPASPVAATTKAGSGTGPGGFTLLLDEGGSASADIDVYYDVCGLTGGARYTARITVSKHESGLKRLLGNSVAPVTATFDEVAGGPAVRRHRTVDMDGMPSGSYSVAVVVTDEKGRRRAKETTIRLQE